eukprot:c5974_g1_i1.p1 GENE.c5974_g1_i1~~c5974_g1_i1.p1  ORF type:complete len:353 (-),score=51.60 c5974_g1_i1:130-1188(-)
MSGHVAAYICNNAFCRRLEVFVPSAEPNHIEQVHTIISRSTKTFLLENWDPADLITPEFIQKYIQNGDFTAVSTQSPDQGNSLLIYKQRLTLNVDQETYTQLGLVGRQSVHNDPHNPFKLFSISVDLSSPSFAPTHPNWERWHWCLSNRLFSVPLVATWFVQSQAQDITPINANGIQKVRLLPLTENGIGQISQHTFPDVNLPKNISNKIWNDGESIEDVDLAEMIPQLFQWCGLIAAKLDDVLEINSLAGKLESTSCLTQSSFGISLELEPRATTCVSLSTRSVLPTSCVLDCLTEMKGLLNQMRSIPFVCVLLWTNVAPFLQQTQSVVFVFPNNRMLLIDPRRMILESGE